MSNLASRGVTAATVDVTCQNRHKRSHGTSYHVPLAKVNPPGRLRPVNPSPTRPPLLASDLGLWPALSAGPHGRPGVALLHEDGTPVGAGGGY